jgi:hypothetical protein
MNIIVRVSAPNQVRPLAGSPIHVEARDTTFEDGPAPTIARALGAVRDGTADLLDVIELSLDSLPDSSIVWVHVDSDRDGRVSPGDYLTTISYPISVGSKSEMDVSVRRI